MQHRCGSGLFALALLALACSGKTTEPGQRPATPRSGSGASAAQGGTGSSAAGGGAAGSDTLPGVPRDDDAGTSLPSKLVISPDARSLTVDPVDPQPIAFSVKLNDGSPSALAPRWQAEPRELGSIDAATGQLKPSGAAGKLTVTVSAGSLTTTVTIELTVKRTLEGDPDADKQPGGAGGLGGVGGEGGGSKIGDAKLRAALDASAQDDADLKWLYPYDGTVWPRGLPAPLLQWSHGAHAPLAVKLRVEAGPSFVSEIYLGAPAALGGGKPIDRLPIPQAIWRNALLSGSSLKVSLTVAASDGAGGYAAYKAPQSLSWMVAPTSLKGVVYYNSYGTKLAENFGGAKGGNGRFGGATLAIRGGAFDPELVAGSTTTDDSGCRVCHTVAAGGSLLLSQRQSYTGTSAYDLRNMNRERMLPPADDKKFGWAALSPDGSVALGNSGPPGSDTNGPSSLPSSALYKTSDGSVLTAQNLASFVTQAATPAFAPDMSMLAFNFWQGPGTSAISGDGKSIVIMDVKRIDDTTYDFSKPRVVYKASQAGQLPAWPFFLPDNSGVVFQLEVAPASMGKLFTWRGARGELWWADLAGHAHALERANGKGYLPSGGNGHDDDTTLQYEPTVAPIVAGGYAWVVFTSRRAYGNVATRPPYESDPREIDLTPGNSAGPTTKKLWVSALSVPAKSDTDPSHPAFYLPAQELYAGNSRGFWVLDACKEDKASCTSGDECCGGYCSISEEFGVGVCSKVPPDTCSKEYDKCNVTADCCAGKGLSCIAGRCATVSLQ